VLLWFDRVADMGERTQYAPGTFCWADLATTDQDAAKSFYGELLGWEFEDIPVGDGVNYSMSRRDGRSLAAIAPQPPQARDAGAPPAWNSYVSVESADSAADRAQELGATVQAPPFDVMDVGRMAVIQDPQGAFFMVWEPRNQIGARIVNEPGALVWNELVSPDLDAGRSFYSDLFGWTLEAMSDAPMTYYMIKNGDATNGGMREPQPPDLPPHWLVYFGVEEMDSALGQVEQLGGRKLAGPIDMGAGVIGVAQDPQGAAFALWAGQMAP
jgi:uncharacterized protein